MNEWEVTLWRHGCTKESEGCTCSRTSPVSILVEADDEQGAVSAADALANEPRIVRDRYGQPRDASARRAL